MVVLVDDEDRENEGDLIFAADFVTPDKINFLAKHGRGLVCMPITVEHARAPAPAADDAAQPLGARHQLHRVDRSGAGHHHRHLGRGPRAHDHGRVASATPRPEDIVQPGHVFPLIAQPGGVLARAGHTEACCDLARLAGLTPAAVLCEIMNDDGTMARRADLEHFAAAHGLKIGAIADLIHYRSRTEKLVERIAERPLTTHRRRVPARRLSRQAHRRDASGAGARPDLPGHRDARARARAAVGDRPARHRRARRIRGASPRRSARSRRPGAA